MGGLLWIFACYDDVMFCGIVLSTGITMDSWDDRCCQVLFCHRKSVRDLTIWFLATCQPTSKTYSWRWLSLTGDVESCTLRGRCHPLKCSAWADLLPWNRVNQPEDGWETRDTPSAAICVRWPVVVVMGEKPRRFVTESKDTVANVSYVPAHKILNDSERFVYGKRG